MVYTSLHKTNSTDSPFSAQRSRSNQLNSRNSQDLSVSINRECMGSLRTPKNVCVNFLFRGGGGSASLLPDLRTEVHQGNHAAWNSATPGQSASFQQNNSNGVAGHTSQQLLHQQTTAPSLNAPPGVSTSSYGQNQQHSISGPLHSQFPSQHPPHNASDTRDSPPAQHTVPPASTSSSQATGLPQTPAQQILISPADRWGLLGLLALIKSSDPDVNLLSYGQDLGTMGMDMNAQRYEATAILTRKAHSFITSHISSSFITPWSDSSAAHTVEPDFHLPPCYNVQPAPPGPSKAAAFSDETLFFMFYSSPRDALQEVAAQEL